MYITRSDVTTQLGTEILPAEGLALDAIIDGVESATESYCDRTWNVSGTIEEITEYFDGGGDFFPLLQGPALASPAPTVTDTGTAVSSDSIYNYGSYLKLASATTVGFRNVVITYSTSANQLPKDLKLALIQWCVILFKTAKEGSKDVTSMSVGPLSVSYSDASTMTEAGIPAHIQATLDRHKIHPGF